MKHNQCTLGASYQPEPRVEGIKAIIVFQILLELPCHYPLNCLAHKGNGDWYIIVEVVQHQVRYLILGWMMVSLTHEGRHSSLSEAFIMFMAQSTITPLVVTALISHAGQWSSKEVVGLQKTRTLEASSYVTPIGSN